jgi:hypothetical protein
MKIIKFFKSVKYEPVEHSNKKEWYRLTENYRSQWERNGVLESIHIKAGYEWDGATIPRILWTPLGYYPMGVLTAPSLIHDYIYVNHGTFNGIDKMSRKESDELFRLHCIKVGVSEKKANLMYNTIRTLGWIYWNDNKLFQTLKLAFKAKS